MKGLILYVLFLPIVIYVISRWVDTRLNNRGDIRWLVAACLTFSLSAFLPSPVIDGMDTQLWTHVVGGGIFCGLLWLYFHRSFGQRVWWYEYIQLLALTSLLGVFNELYELFAYIYLGGWPIRDTSWDLAANTVGVTSFFLIYRVVSFLNTRHKKIDHSTSFHIW